MCESTIAILKIGSSEKIETAKKKKNVLQHSIVDILTIL